MVPGNWHPVLSSWERSSKLCYVCLFFPPTPSCPGAAQALSDIFPFASGEPFNSVVCSLTSLVAQKVKHLPTMWEIQVQFLGWEDSLEKEMATHSSTLA